MTQTEGLLTQIAEPQKGGKQSCFLTSILNAWILRGGLSVVEAQEIQDRVATDPEFSGYWYDQAQFGQDYTAWSGRPMDTAFAVQRIIGRKVALRISSSSAAEAMPLVVQTLEDGYAVVIGTSRHSRTAFVTEEQPDKLFIDDPRYPETTGLYEPDSLSDFHNSNVVVII